MNVALEVRRRSSSRQPEAQAREGFPSPHLEICQVALTPFPALASGEELAPCLQTGCAILTEARDCAQELQRDVWDFAVEVHCLRDAGLSDSSLRWLLCKGYVEHAVETTQARAPHRTFRRAGNLMFCERSCFVLTPRGLDLADQPGSFPRALGGPGQSTASLPRPAIWSEIPRWDADCHELRWAAKLVKRFREPALNQELILAAFEEEGWPPHMDDPLPNNSNYDSKQRLHDTIKRLNRHQINRLIQFRGDGSGCGIIWESLC
jgi:hypothetical protein